MWIWCHHFSCPLPNVAIYWSNASPIGILQFELEVDLWKTALWPWHQQELYDGLCLRTSWAEPGSLGWRPDWHLFIPTVWFKGDNLVFSTKPNQNKYHRQGWHMSGCHSLSQFGELVNSFKSATLIIWSRVSFHDLCFSCKGYNAKMYQLVTQLGPKIIQILILRHFGRFWKVWKFIVYLEMNWFENRKVRKKHIGLVL